MQKANKVKEINVYRIGRITILQLMGVLAALGLVSTWVLHYFFG